MKEAAIDVVVLGGGPGGYACALRAGQLGLTVGLVERDKVGGTCLHRGCIPTKALLHAAEIADRARESTAIGIRTSLEGIDVPALNEYKGGIVTRLYGGLRALLKQRGVVVEAGDGRVVAANAVQVGDVRLEATKALVLATGSTPGGLPGVTVDGHTIVTSDHALELTRLPDSVVVLGGGVIGCEFASVWRSFGVDVTIVEMQSRLLPMEDASSSALLERAFKKRGIRISVGQPVSAVTLDGPRASVTLADASVLSTDLVLVAVGRKPVTVGLGFEEIGLTLSGGYIPVDDHCRTEVENVYAIGDIRPGPQLAHAAFLDGITVAEVIAGEHPAPIDYINVPRITYSDPEVVSVGLTSDQARDLGLEVHEVSYDLSGNARAQILHSAGAAKAVVEASGRVRGLHLVGRGVSELVGEAQLITTWEADACDVASLIHAHPTLTEAVGELHLAAAGKPFHTH